MFTWSALRARPQSWVVGQISRCRRLLIKQRKSSSANDVTDQDGVRIGGGIVELRGCVARKKETDLKDGGLREFVPPLDLLSLFSRP